MKKIIAFVLMLCLAGTSTAFAYGGRHGGYRSYDNGYHERSRHHGHSRSHRNDGVGIALGVVGGLLLGSALVNAAAPPPAVVYAPPRTYRQPRVCVEDQVVSGEWQYSRYDGRQVWVEYAYPVTRRYQVPCY